MPLYRDEALTLRNFDLGESDKIVSFLSLRRGKIRAVAKGARKLKSRFAGRLEPFNSVDVVYFGKENASLYKLSSVDMGGGALRGNASDTLEKFHRACYVVELIELGMREGDPNPKIFRTARKALEWIAREQSPSALDWIVRCFDVKFLCHAGYAPAMDRCVYCGDVFQENGVARFNVAKGGIVCPRCAAKPGSAIPISAGAAKFLFRMIRTDFDRADRLRPSPSIMKEISNVIIAFRNSRIQAKMRSERFFTEEETKNG